MRMSKNKEQVKILENEYKKNSNWTREYMRALASKAGLRES
jgi:hypothetical protein